MTKINSLDWDIYFDWQGRNQKKMLGGLSQGRVQVFSQGVNSRAKPESRARSARELMAKPEPRAKPEKKRGEGSEPLPRNFFEIITWNRAIWCIADAKIEGYEQIKFLRFEEHSSSKNWFYMMWALWNIIKFVHTQSSCNHYCVSNITRRSRISIDVSRCSYTVQYIWLRCLETPQLANVIYCASIGTNSPYF